MRRQLRESVFDTFSGAEYAFTVGGVVATLALAFGMAWLLLFRIEWFADRLRFREDGSSSPLSGDTILHVGTKLLGLFVIVQASFNLVEKLGNTITLFHRLTELQHLTDPVNVRMLEREILNDFWSSFIAPACKLAMGLVLALKTDTVRHWIEGKKQTRA